MKSFMEKVKDNKLRSACIGLSAFLFGFIAVSVFNNIDDTYATSGSTGKCYVCDTSQSYVWSTSKPSSSCSGGGWYEKSSITSKTSCIGTCWTCDTSQSYVWSTSKPSSSCPGGGWYEKSSITSEASCTGKCWTCDVSQSFVWSPTKPSSSCPGGSWYTKSGITSEASCTGKCYVCDTSQSYVWSVSKPSSSCSGGSWYTKSGIASSNRCNYYYFNNACYVCGSSQYVWGKNTDGSCKLKKDYTTESSCLANNSEPAPSQNPGYFTGGGSSSGGSSSEEPEPDVIADTIQYYKVTYDLDGGKLIDGKTSKTQYVRGDKAVGTPGTNPIKDGYAFIQWEYNGNNFDFNTKLDDIKSSLSTTTENGVTIYTITLKATYAEFDYSDLECPSGTVLDPSVRKCYSVLSDSSYPSYTLETYSAGTRYCYAYNNSQGKPGGIAIHSTATADCPTTGNVGTGSAGLCKIEGKNNKTDGKYSEYGKSDAWMSKNSCFVASTCTAELTNSSACEIRWNTILYNVSDATIKEVTIPEEPVDEGEDPSDPDGSTDPDNSTDPDGSGNNKEEPKEDTNDKDKTDDELTNNSKTGDALIFVAWVIGIGALAYSVYYFKLKKENI